jgi:hypothetical protein
MQRLPLVLLATLTLAAPALAAANKLAPPRKVEQMLGGNLVIGKSDDITCGVTLFEDKVEQGYRFEADEACTKAFPIIAKVKAWRVYQNTDIAFADAGGQDILRFHGKKYHYLAAKNGYGIVKLWSDQEVAE